MAYMAMRLIFDQNVSVICACWLREKKPEWNIVHVNEIGFNGRLQ
jgi:hypothetical protein